MHRRAFAAVSPAPIRYIVLTQGHVDHVDGIDLFKEEHPDALVIAQRNIAACQADDERIQAFRYRRNVRFFPEFLAPHASGDDPSTMSGLGPAQSVARPDVTFDDEHRFELGGVRSELLSVSGGETIDSVLVWLPTAASYSAATRSAPCSRTSPTCIRSGAIACASLCPTSRSSRRSSTSDGMNAGKDVFTLMREIRLPEHLEVGQAYGTVPWCVRAIFEGYAGWFRFRSTTELYDRPVDDVYGELAGLAGVDALAQRAAALLADGRTLEAVHLAEIALAGDPRHAGALVVYKEAHERLLAMSEPGNRWQVYWLRGEIERARTQLAEAQTCSK